MTFMSGIKRKMVGMMADDRKCPLGDECDLTVAWLAGSENQREHDKGRIEDLTMQLEMARYDSDQQRKRAEHAEQERHTMRDRIEALTAERDTALAQLAEEGRKRGEAEAERDRAKAVALHKAMEAVYRADSAELAVEGVVRIADRIRAIANKK